MDESKKKQWQLESEAIAFYSIEIDVNYDLFVGLVLNLPRIKKQLSHIIADAFRLIYPGEEIDLEWFESISDTKEEAKKMWQKANMKLQIQKAKYER